MASAMVHVQPLFYGSFTLRDEGGDMADGLVSGALLTGRCRSANGRWKALRHALSC